MAFAGGLLGTAGTALTAFSRLRQGAFAARVARNNAQVADYNARYARRAGVTAAANESMKAAETMGAIKGAIAANNVDVNTGSAADVQAGAREVAKLDVDTVLNNAELTAYGYTVQAKNFRDQAKQDEAGGIFDALGTLLSNAKGLSTKWGSATV